MSEEYIALAKSVTALPYMERLEMISLLAESLKEVNSAPESVTVTSSDDLHQKLQKGLDDIKAGRVFSAED